MIIRPVTRGDAEALSAIFSHYVRDTATSFEMTPPDAAEMRARVEATIPIYPWLVAEAGGLIVGYAYASQHRPKPAYRWSVDVSVYLRDGQAGRGVGTALYGDLLPRVEALGYANVFAGISLPNAASVALHERFGFRLIGVYERIGFKLGAWHDVGWWQKSFAHEVLPSEPRKTRW